MLLAMVRICPEIWPWVIDKPRKRDLHLVASKQGYQLVLLLETLLDFEESDEVLRLGNFRAL